ncbi:putative type 1 membrane protein [Raphanus sativus]|nr:putative type 1 membrane protein [Raphanus sativus]
MSLSEVSASVSALLGFAPPSTLTAMAPPRFLHPSTNLNKILKPNPFERPRAAFVLEIAGAHDALVEAYTSHSFLGDSIRGSISSDSYNADIELPGSGVAVVSVNEPSSDVTDKDMNEFASWLGGSYVTDSAEPLTGLLSIPLADGANVEFHLKRGVVNLHGDLSHGIERPAELTVGRFVGINVLAQEYGQGMAKQGMDVLLATLSKLFDMLETSSQRPNCWSDRP